MENRQAPHAPIPVYYQLQSTLQRQIEDGHWGPGQRIPTERELAETHGLSIGTVKKAILNLVHDGYLYRVQGRGTFVSGTTIRRESLRYYRLLDDFQTAEAALSVKLLAIERRVDAVIARRYLQLRADRPLYAVDRLFTSEGRPVIFCTSFLPCDRFAGLDTRPVTLFEKMTLYEALEKEYGVTTVYNQKLIGAVAAAAPVADRLRVAPGTPLLFIEMISYTYRERPYEYRRSFCLTDRRRLAVEI